MEAASFAYHGLTRVVVDVLRAKVAGLGPQVEGDGLVEDHPMDVLRVGELDEGGRVLLEANPHEQRDSKAEGAIGECVREHRWRPSLPAPRRRAPRTRRPKWPLPHGRFVARRGRCVRRFIPPSHQTWTIAHAMRGNVVVVVGFNELPCGKAFRVVLRAQYPSPALPRALTPEDRRQGLHRPTSRDRTHGLAAQRHAHDARSPLAPDPRSVRHTSRRRT